MQRTCCQRAEIVLTLGDLERIERAAGTDNHERRVPADPSYLEDDPNGLRWTKRPDGTRRVLRRRPDGDCVLEPAGCELARDARPLVCRLYPYAYFEESIVGHDDEDCPTGAITPDGLPMATVLGVELEDARLLARDPVP